MLLRTISNVHEGHIWPSGRRFPTLGVMRAWLAGTLIISTGEPNKNVTVKFLTKHLAYVKFYISFFVSVLNSSIQNIQFSKNQTHYAYVWQS